MWMLGVVVAVRQSYASAGGVSRAAQLIREFTRRA